jgi:hypothetical protein
MECKVKDTTAESYRDLMLALLNCWLHHINHVHTLPTVFVCGRTTAGAKGCQACQLATVDLPHRSAAAAAKASGHESSSQPRLS